MVTTPARERLYELVDGEPKPVSFDDTDALRAFVELRDSGHTRCVIDKARVVYTSPVTQRVYMMKRPVEKTERALVMQVTELTHKVLVNIFNTNTGREVPMPKELRIPLHVNTEGRFCNAAKFRGWLFPKARLAEALEMIHQNTGAELAPPGVIKAKGITLGKAENQGDIFVTGPYAVPEKLVPGEGPTKAESIDVPK